MRIDNSAANKWRACPLEYFERYEAVYPDAKVLGIEPKQMDSDGRLFGSRMHELLHEYNARMAGKPLGKDFPACPNAKLEAEAQAAFAGYLAYYPVEPFKVVEAERVHVVPLGESDHELVVKMDALIRNKYGALQVKDLKTMRHGSKGNDAEHWAARPQIALYIYAARFLYPDEKVSDEVMIDLIERQSDKGLVAAGFKRDSPRRTPEQIADAVRDIVWVADQIEAMRDSGYWPAFRDKCKVNNWKCDYYHLHNSPDSRLVQLEKNFKPAEPYLEEV